MSEQDQLPLSAENLNYDGEDRIFQLRLFVAGASPNSLRAITNLKEICETHLKGRYVLDIIDVHQQPLIAEEEQVIALPLLIKKAPGTVRRLIGDMSNLAKVLHGLNITTEE